jgi:Domain of unknown function (DUF4333)
VHESRRPSTRTVLALVAVALLAAVAVLVVIRLTDRPRDGISAEELAEGAEEALQADTGARPDVSCADGLQAEVGARARCTLTAGGDQVEYGVEVTVTAVDGQNFTVDVQVDEEPVG